MSVVQPLCIVKVLVFNQEQYVEDCLKGLVTQQTTFPFVAVVHDDASTDNSAAIIKRYAEQYPEVIHPIIEKENLWSKHDGSLNRIMETECTKAKYIAFCEGDDYWTDPFKLQKQINYLESHPECALCHTGVSVRRGEDIEMRPSPTFRNDMLEDLLLNNKIATVSVVMKSDVRKAVAGFTKEIMGKMADKLPFNDHNSWLYAAYIGEIHYLPESTAVYRISDGSVTRQGNLKKGYLFDVQSFRMRDLFYNYLKTRYKFSPEFDNDFHEFMFHSRKSMIKLYGINIAYPQIWELLNLIPYYPMIISRWLKRMRK